MEEETAINVKDEVADTFYLHLKDLPKGIKEKMSFYMLDNIFKKMVVPAIDQLIKNFEDPYVSIAERLPPVDVEILFYHKSGNGSVFMCDKDEDNLEEKTYLLKAGYTHWKLVGDPSDIT